MGMFYKNEMVSIIVPVYNCECYISECIESICSQTYENIEIILVDDGSTDRFGSICEEYAAKDSRITVIHQKNGKQQDARNAGINAAEGKYIGFVDSDDWVEPIMYERLLTQMADCDLVTSGIYRYGPEGEMIDTWTDLLPSGIYSCEDNHFLDNLIIAENYKGGVVIGGISNNLVSKLFRTSLVKEMAESANVHVVEEEDFLFVLLYILKCRKIKITEDIYYHYRNNPHSVVNSMNVDHLAERTRYYNTIMKALDRWPVELKLQFQRRFLFRIFSETGKKLGINDSIQYPAFLFPDTALLADRRIVIFGASQVGISYLLRYRKMCRIVAWIDNRLTGKEVLGFISQSPDTVTGLKFDFVVCAVLNQVRADAMRKQMISLGVNGKKILWREPVNLWREFFLRGEVVRCADGCDGMMCGQTAGQDIALQGRE